MFFDLPPVLPLELASPTLSISVSEHAEAALTCARASGTRVDKLLVADMNRNANEKRLSIFDVSDPANPRLLFNDYVAHGSGSDPQRTGLAQRFSNIMGSSMTSLGLYKVAERYHWHGGGWSFRLDGLTAGFNTQARDRAVVFHPSNYVTENGVGRSQGCPAIRPELMAQLAKQGLENTMLWIDGPDQKLATAEVLNCPKAKEFLRRQASTQDFKEQGFGMSQAAL
jgi:hypothetical protein